jgi:hypothetical protein
MGSPGTSADPTMSTNKRGSNYSIDVVKLNLEASRRVKATLRRGPTHAGQFAYAGKICDRVTLSLVNKCFSQLFLASHIIDNAAALV